MDVEEDTSSTTATDGSTPCEPVGVEPPSPALRCRAKTKADRRCTRSSRGGDPWCIQHRAIVERLVAPPPGHAPPAWGRPATNETCPICCDRLLLTASREEAEAEDEGTPLLSQVTLACGHGCHTECIVGLLHLRCPLCRHTIAPPDVPPAVFRAIHAAETVGRRREMRERAERDSVMARRLFYTQRITLEGEWSLLHALRRTAWGRPLRFRRRVSYTQGGTPGLVGLWNVPSLQTIIMMVPPGDLEAEGGLPSPSTASIMEDAVDDWWRAHRFAPERLGGGEGPELHCAPAPAQGDAQRGLRPRPPPLSPLGGPLPLLLSLPWQPALFTLDSIEVDVDASELPGSPSAP